MKMFRKDEGFTLVELMVVVLIIGILVAIAVPVFLNASANAQAKSCQANQRTVIGAVSTFNATYPTAQIVVGTAGLLGTAGNSADLFAANATAGTQPVIKSIPKCPAASGTPNPGEYVIGTALTITGDTGAAVWVNADHTLK